MFLQQPLAFENRTDEDGAPVKNSKCSGLQKKTLRGSNLVPSTRSEFAGKGSQIQKG